MRSHSAADEHSRPRALARRIVWGRVASGSRITRCAHQKQPMWWEAARQVSWAGARAATATASTHARGRAIVFAARSRACPHSTPAVSWEKPFPWRIVTPA